MHGALTSRVLRGALAGAAAAALTACAGESPTETGMPYPYDIVFERREGTSGAPDLYYLDLETRDQRRVLASGISGMHPSAGPGGSRIAFVRMDNEFNLEIFTASRTGTDMTNVSNHAEADVMPAWSPDGQRIAFVTDREGYQDIFVVNANGTGLRRVTPADPFPAVTTEWWPAWSPNGQLIAFSSTIDGTPDIWTMTVDETPFRRERRTATPDNDQHPTWSPQGDRIAFQRIDHNTGEADIVILTLSPGTVQKITMPGQQLWPAWSPEGDLIAFSSNHDGSDFEIYTMRVDGSDVVRRTNNGLNDLRPTWILRPLP